MFAKSIPMGKVTNVAYTGGRQQGYDVEHFADFEFGELEYCLVRRLCPPRVGLSQFQRHFLGRTQPDRIPT